jgi:anthranilate/para-aminobenzoate synthase component I
VVPPVARELGVPARPVQLARKIQDEPGALFLWDAAGGGPSYVACWPSHRVASFDPDPGGSESAAHRSFARFPRWFGILPYEARRQLERPAWTAPEDRPAPHHETPLWYRYPAVAEVTDRVRVVGEDPSAVADLAHLLSRSERRRAVSLGWVLQGDCDDAHRDRIERARELIRDGHVYQVNLARRLHLEIRGQPADLLERMARVAPTPYGLAARLDGIDVISTSPELFLSVEPSGRVRTRPIKGTRPRGADAPADRARIEELDADPKERAELSMVVDVERNDLSRVSVPGSVRVPRDPTIETRGSVHHRICEVQSRLRPGVGRTELLVAMLPSGSVTGAPKIRAMEVIRQLEAYRRGLYTGAYGVIRWDGSMELAMAIRTLTVAEGEGHYFTGGGIVLDSNPASEVLETKWKALQLTRLMTP